MTIQPGTIEYNLFFTLTVILLLFKLALSIYLGKKIINRKKQAEKFSIDFIFSIFFLATCLFISRLLYAYWDFFLTQFDPTKFHLMPSIIYWKIAAFVSTVGYFVVLYVIDKKALNFKLKGIIAYIILIAGLIQLIYPVNTPGDFEFISAVGLLGNLAAIVIPIIFLNIGIKTPGLRKTSFMIAFGVIIYAIGATIVVEAIMAPLRIIFGNEIQIVLFLLFFIFKITGLTMFAYGFMNFTI